MSQKSNTGRLKFVDAHMHLYDIAHPELRYGHWQTDEDHPVLGSDIRRLATRSYTAEDFIDEASPHGMVKCVHIECAIGSKDPVSETRWLQNVYEQTGFPQAIVGKVDLRSSDSEKQIEHHSNYKNFRGIRDFHEGDYLASDDFMFGFSLLSKYDLVAHVSAQIHNMQQVADLARTYSDTIIVLDHAGFPNNPDHSKPSLLSPEEYSERWIKGMSMLASEKNVICKISGLGMGNHQWTVESIRDNVRTCIDLFGCERSLFASNWPVDGLWGTYGDMVNAFVEITKDFTQTEKNALFASNAERIYKI